MNKPRKETIRLFFAQVKKFKWAVVVLLMATVAHVFAQIYAHVVFRDFLDVLISAPDVNQAIYNSALGLLLLYAGVVLVEILGDKVVHVVNIFFQTRAMGNLAADAFNYIHKHSFEFFNNTFIGSLVKKVNRYVRAFERVADIFTWNFFRLFLTIVFVLVWLFLIQAVLGWVVVIWVVVFLSVNYWFALKKVKFDLAKAAADSVVSGALADTFTNNANVKLFAGLRYEYNQFMAIVEDWMKKTRKAWTFGFYIELWQGVFMTILELVVLYIALNLWFSGSVAAVDLVLIQGLLLQIFFRTWDFGRLVRDLYESFSDAEEMAEILLQKHDIEDKKGARDLPIKRGGVRFDSVFFSYNKGEKVIENLSFDVKPAQKVALIGPSGGGKSTVVKLLLRLYNINKGKILLDGVSIDDFTQDSLRAQVALVPQDPIMFHRTIMENIRYGRRNATDDEVMAAAKMAYCHEFIMRFKEGYNTFVGERGVKLSGGQRQRVAIARAILSNARILVLDEATSSLDSESEVLIQRALENLWKNKTAFIIAHRLSTVMKADKIFVIEEGRIVETGTHADLVNKKGSMYGKMWDLQVGGYN